MNVPRSHRPGTLAVPVTAAIVASAATLAVGWAAMTPHGPRRGGAAATATVTGTGAVRTVTIGDDDSGVRTVVVAATGTTSVPATHTTTGASGAIRP